MLKYHLYKKTTTQQARWSTRHRQNCFRLETSQSPETSTALPDLDIKNKLRELIKENYTNFAFQINKSWHTSLVEQKIDTQGCDPIRQRAYRPSSKQKKLAQEIIDELLENKIIRFSMSPWDAPIVSLQKKTGDIRLSVPIATYRWCTRFIARPTVFFYVRSCLWLLANWIRRGL